jgi:hypothetical protein
MQEKKRARASAWPLLMATLEPAFLHFRFRPLYYWQTICPVECHLPQLAKKNLAAHLRATPRQMDRELRAFSRAARLLSSDHPRLIERHPKQWVGVYDGKVCATGKSLNALMAKLKKSGISPRDAIIRYIDTSGRKLIL